MEEWNLNVFQPLMSPQFHKTRVELFRHQTALKTHSADTGASALSVFTLQISCWYSLFAKVDTGSAGMEREITVKYGSRYDLSENNQTKSHLGF